MKGLVGITGALLLTLVVGLGWLWQRAHAPWTQWQAYAEHFIQPDGRVVDITAGRRSTSEGQAYSLFFALVANDRARFDQILNWTRDNLCDGDFAKRLPAWLWGQRDDGSWGVLDPNAAADADLWIAYTLLQAARIWQDPALAQTARLLLWQIKAQEVVVMGASGKLMLPAPLGFVLDGSRWKLNPSYYPRFQFQGLASDDPEGPWLELWQNYERLLPQIAPRGVVPDWFVLDEAGRVLPDVTAPNLGSYDAIRAYLWPALSVAIDAAGLQRYGGYLDAIRAGGLPPEKIDIVTGAVSGTPPVGFSAAVLPWLKGLSEDAAVQNQLQELQKRRHAGLLGQPAHYYDQVLALFGEGGFDGRYRFDADGRLILRWERLWFGR